MNAILACVELSFSFPKDLTTIRTTAAEFTELSRGGALNGNVGCIDRWLCRIRVPSATETDHVTSYFSGHYQCYSVNVQAVCGARCRFTYVSVVSPGGANDCMAFVKSSLYDIVNNLPYGFYIIGDNAYVISEKSLTPYSGKQKLDLTKDSLNFYVSQLRIRIE